MFPLPATLIELLQSLELAGLGFYLSDSLRAITTFATVSLALFANLEGAQRLNLISDDVLEVLGPLMPFSLLVASVIWSLFATIECVLVETPLPAWMAAKFIAVMLMVAFVISPITILLGIPICSIVFSLQANSCKRHIRLRHHRMSLECIWYARIDRLGVR